MRISSDFISLADDNLLKKIGHISSSAVEILLNSFLELYINLWSQILYIEFELGLYIKY